MASSMFKRILSLNLAVLLGLTLTVPAMGLEEICGKEPLSLEEAIEEARAMQQAREEFLQDAEEDQILLFAETPAFVVDGSSQVSGTEDVSGTGWTYDAGENVLSLTDTYGGAPLQIYSGLTIRIEGDVTIQSPDSESFGNSAIYHTFPTGVTPEEGDELVIEVAAGSSLKATGGYGKFGGGSAVRSTYDVSIHSEGTITLQGGNSLYHGYTSSGESKQAYAGDGINANNITITGQNISAAGGNILTSHPSYGHAGNGLSAKEHISVSGRDFTFTGGTSGFYGGYGAYTTGTISVSANDADFCGGEAFRGGYGIFSSGDVILNPVSAKGDIVLVPGHIFAKGASGDLTSGTGGRGIATLGSLSVRSDCTIQGGSGSTNSAGITYGKNCYFGLVNALIRGQGPSDAYPISYYEGASEVEFHDHVSTQIKGGWMMVTINEYTLTFSGNGGTLDGKESFSDTAPYPTYYNLPDYPFTRDGYALMGWSLAADASSSYTSQVVPLNDRRFPKADFTLYAMWASTDGNPVILNGLDGKLAGTLLYESYQEAVTLPEKLDYENNQLLAWNTEIIPVEDPDTHLFSGIWHEGGKTVAPTDTPTILYGQSAGDGSYAVYHLGSGTAPEGGTLLVQGTRAAGSGLQVLTPDKTQVSAPDGLFLAGWATSENGEVQYECGEKVTLKSGTVTHLYACWEDAAIETETDHGLRISFTPSQKSVCITAPENWGEDSGAKLLVAALYASNNQLLQATAQDLSADRTELTLTYDTDTVPILRIFTLDQDQRPTGNHTELDLKTLE